MRGGRIEEEASREEQGEREGKKKCTGGKIAKHTVIRAAHVNETGRELAHHDAEHGSVICADDD